MGFKTFLMLCCSVGAAVLQHQNSSVAVLSVATLQQIWEVHYCPCPISKSLLKKGH